MVGMKKNKRTADGFQNFLLGLQFLIKFDKIVNLEEINEKCLKNVEKQWVICRWGLLVSCWLHLLGNAPIGSPLLYRHFPKWICYSVSVANKAPILYRHFPKSCQYPFGADQMSFKSF
jgi:hypothetical protein